MAFEKTKYNNKFPDDWEWAGNKTIEGYDTEGGKYQPPDELKEQGFTPGYKPPAEFFNWFWRKVIKCVREIQTLFKSHREAEVLDHPDESVTAEKIAPNAVIEEKIFPGAVTETKIAPEAVTNEKIGPDAITREKIKDGEIIESKVAPGAITDEKISDVDASKIKSGVIDVARIPPVALERLTKVANKAARFALTKDKVQNGDTVQELDTGLMYLVADDTKLNSDDGYTEYAAGTAARAPWSGITGKPDTFPPDKHTHQISDVLELLEALNGTLKRHTQVYTTTEYQKKCGYGVSHGGGNGNIPPSKHLIYNKFFEDGIYILENDNKYLGLEYDRIILISYGHVTEDKESYTHIMIPVVDTIVDVGHTIRYPKESPIYFRKFYYESSGDNINWDYCCTDWQILHFEPVSHASSSDVYGLGDGAHYGHVSLTDAVDEMKDCDTDSGIAVTPKGVYDHVEKIIKDMDKAAKGVVTEETMDTTFEPGVYYVNNHGAPLTSTDATPYVLVVANSEKSGQNGTCYQIYFCTGNENDPNIICYRNWDGKKQKWSECEEFGSDINSGTWANPFVVSDPETNLSTLTKPGIYYFDFEDVKEISGRGTYNKGYMEVSEAWGDNANKVITMQRIFVGFEGQMFQYTRTVNGSLENDAGWNRIETSPINSTAHDADIKTLFKRVIALEDAIKSLNGTSGDDPFDGDVNAFNTKITTLENTVKELKEKSDSMQVATDEDIDALLAKYFG